ncbi:TetR/AcrR family transcriptional regulator [Mycolicibacterium novocastrense]|nr:TetR/AcrR family transcriptional regulator [Mycolicibacterium novocastrense]
MTAPTSAGRRVTAQDWIQTGFAVLAEGGPGALRIGRLCERLDVTKGSFYWHFTDMPAYRDALARAWANHHDEQRRRFEDMGGDEPRARLIAMIQTLMCPDQWALERAMRVWSLTDRTVLASVHQSDVRVLSAVRDALVDYGFDDGEADLRSALLFATGIGLLHEVRSAPREPALLSDRVLDLMLHR